MFIATHKQNNLLV